uniref:Uncharacterized protein n=1 Tax=Ditylum brightwellii TaxID=49249 RepID=A0A6V2IST8_9STRA|mmetsp:Transcript_69806/g.103840  ORF Transcript_69806/g.103840 Transcript_69806/m.103840 type:complete len:252 (-) Transcript_69806:819-1574(-)
MTANYQRWREIHGTTSKKNTIHSYLCLVILVHFFLGYEHHLSEYGVPLGHYANLWLCSASLLLTAIGIGFCYPNLVGLSLVSVSAGHVAWIIDTLVMIITHQRSGPFVIASYSSLRNRHRFWHNIIVASHHIWFMPVALYYLRSISYNIGRRDFIGGIIWVLMISGASILILPKDCMDTVFEDGTELCTMPNINMIQGWWGVNDVALIHYLDRSKGGDSFLYFVYANFLYSFVLNGACFLVLQKIAKRAKR